MSGRFITIIAIGILFLWISHFVPLRADTGYPSVECQQARFNVEGEQVDPATVNLVKTGFPLRTFQSYDNELCSNDGIPIGQWILFIINVIFWFFVVFIITRNLEGPLFRPPLSLILAIIAIIVSIFGFMNIFSMYG